MLRLLIFRQTFQYYSHVVRLVISSGITLFSHDVTGCDMKIMKWTATHWICQITLEDGECNEHLHTGMVEIYDGTLSNTLIYRHICRWLVQERRNPIANALKLRLSSTNPSMYAYSLLLSSMWFLAYLRKYKELHNQEQSSVKLE